ncbi:hypothetical protein BaRGS_00009034 [Batillaria attramentaria]|uniref:RING-type domain-containing protein n=1 Tax=Batillaria attramentaria TaxID=370345 RepID=A0ABD0LKK4_9CAEN
MAGQGLPIAIPVGKLEEYFQCSICLNTMQQVVVTSCGHRYCDKCIREWVDRHHSCPCCNGSLDTSRLIKDHQFDGLIGTCKEEKDKAESTYFDNLIHTAVTKGGEVSDQTFAGTPVEEVLKKHLKQSLAAHELYFQDLRHQYEVKAQHLEFRLRKEMERLQLDGLPPHVLNEKIQELEGQIQEKKESLTAEMQNCQQLVAEAYDRYLTDHIPHLDVLPVKVTVVIADKGIKLPDITLSPSDTLTVIQTAVEEGLKQRGDEVIRWHPDGGKVLIVSPLSRQSSYNVTEILADVSSGGDAYPGIEQVAWLTKPVLQHHMKPGSEIVLHGCLVCESDLPKVCYAQKHKEQGPHKVDYFSCKQCGFNWICRSCIQVCHKDHSVAVHVLNHQPTWACCYCPKKKTCCLKSRS